MLVGHGWLQIPWLQILALNGLSLTPGWNMGLEIVAIHPNSGATWRHQQHGHEYRSFRHSGARVKRASPESITTTGSMDTGPAPQVGNCRPKAHPGMTKVELVGWVERSDTHHRQDRKW